MRPEDLFKIIGEIDDNIIESSDALYSGEAARFDQTAGAPATGPRIPATGRPKTTRYRRRRWVPAVAAAACVLVGFAGLYAVLRPKGSAMSEATAEYEEAAEEAAEYEETWDEAAPEAAEEPAASANFDEKAETSPAEEAYAEPAEEEMEEAETESAGNAAGEISAAEEDEEMASAENIGVTLTASDVTAEGLTLTCAQSGGEVTGELMTGVAYDLEQLGPAYLKDYEAGRTVPESAWEAVPPLAEIAWTEEGLPIALDSKTEWTVDWTTLYGELDKGVYRIGKRILDLRAPGDYDTYQAWAIFEIE